ncbi:hypothetical protein [Stratiformator vulcanicus]|uniref:Chromosome partition protein Smc n=1 Tax=Stratiformator vulcanicus TaxID=2527980 RepID=A0A517QY72_9PLAN|nr:hypothetical protein [Stratiformator vulcanicus]QDT36602.1 hypothetical protein Pan189_09620 [Stratiformator vulcanicus]
MTRTYPQAASRWLAMLATAAVIAAVAGQALAQDRYSGDRYADDRYRSPSPQPTAGFAQVDDRAIIQQYNMQGFGDGFERPDPFAPTLSIQQNNVDVARVRRDIDTFSRLSNELYTELDRMRDRLPAVRNRLADVLRLRARSRLLADRVTNYSQLQQYLTDIQGLDRDWRQISYDLRAVRGLDRNAIRLIDELDRANADISTALKIQNPTLDYRQLVLTSAELRAGMSTLRDDIDIELGRLTNARNLLLIANQAQQQAAHFAGLTLEKVSRDELANEFKRFERVWTELETGVRAYNNRYVERSVRRVRDSESRLRELLLIPQEMDTADLIYTTRTLERDVNDFFNKAPLMVLMRLPEASVALPTADQFYGVLENFVDNVERNQTPEDIIDAYGYVEDAYRSFERVFRPINSEDAQVVLNEVEKNMRSLQSAMLIEEPFDRRVAGEIAAELENLSMHLDQDVRRWLSRSRPPYRDQALRDVQNYVANARALHETVVTGGNVRDIKQRADQMWNDWIRVYQHITKCDTSERPYLARTSSRTTPKLVELRTLLQ